MYQFDEKQRAMSDNNLDILEEGKTNSSSKTLSSANRSPISKTPPLQNHEIEIILQEVNDSLQNNTSSVKLL